MHELSVVSISIGCCCASSLRKLSVKLLEFSEPLSSWASMLNCCELSASGDLFSELGFEDFFAAAKNIFWCALNLILYDFIGFQQFWMLLAVMSLSVVMIKYCITFKTLQLKLFLFGIGTHILSEKRSIEKLGICSLSVLIVSLFI